MIALPIAAALVALSFGVHLLVRSGRRRAWHEAVWGVAMLMFFVATGALVLGVADGWSSTEFRAYWLFGAVLNVPYLALGEVYLLARQRWAGHVLLVILLGATAWASAEVRSAPLDTSVLRTEEARMLPPAPWPSSTPTRGPPCWCWGSCGPPEGCGGGRSFGDPSTGRC